MAQFKPFLLVFLLPILLLSCAVGTDPGECTTLECLPAQFRLHLVKLTFGNSLFSSQEAFVLASFLRPGNRRSEDRPSDRVFPAVLYMNQIDLSGSAGVDDSYSGGGNADSILAPPGQFNVWTVYSNELPPFRDSIQTPLNDLYVHSPVEDQKYSADEGFTIAIDGNPTPEHPVFLRLTYSSWSDDFETDIMIDTTMTSNEPLMITPELRQRWKFASRGRLRISASQRYEQRKEVEPGVRSLLTYVNQHIVSITLTD